MDIKKLLFSLSEAATLGNIRAAADLAKGELSKYAEVDNFGAVGVIARINKGADRTLVLDAHIDEVGFVVTSVLEDGFLKVSNVGGIDPRILPATKVTVHAKKELTALFTSVPPHLVKEEASVVCLEDILLDTGLGENAREQISVGDFVSYNSFPLSLSADRLCGKALDDRAGVACLIELASRIYDKDIPYNIIILLSEQEELGTRGAVTGAFATECDEAIAIDVSFGSAPNIPPEKCGVLGKGAMIGISPILNKKMTDRLTDLAKEKNIPYQSEVMGGKTGTDADVISISKCGVPCALLSIPLRNMHTPFEVVDLLDIYSVCDLLEAYILTGGAFNG